MSYRSAYVGALAILAFVMGAVVMSLEMLASRYLTPFFGGAITTWGAIISTVLAALAIGYYAGGALADRHPHPARLGLLTLPAAIYMAALPVFAPGFALWMATNIEDIRWGVLVASIALFCPPLILLGAYSPFIIRLVIRGESHSGRVAGLIYAISTAGSILGTLVTTFYLVPHFGTRAITLGLSAATALCGVSLFALGQMIEAKQVAGRAVSRTVEVAAGIGTVLYLAVALLILSMNGAFAAEADASSDTGAKSGASSFARGFFQRDDQLAFVESPYNTIIVTEQAPYRSMLFGYRERQYTETRINFADTTELPVTYTRAMTAALAFTDKADRLLMIGLGGGSTTGYLSYYMPALQIEVAELDPDVIKLARDYFNVEPSATYKLAAVDGRLYLNRHETRYDIIMVDAYRGWFVPFHLTTQEFYRLAQSRLTPGGILAQNIERTTLLFDSTVATLKSVFDHVALYKGGYNIVAIAYDGAVKDEAEIGVRAAELQARHGFRYTLPDLLKESVPLDYDKSTEPLTDDFAPANMLHLTPRD